MPEIVAEISMSLDGFVTGPDPVLEHGLGTGGEALHSWSLLPTMRWFSKSSAMASSQGELWYWDGAPSTSFDDQIAGVRKCRLWLFSP